MQPNVVDSSKEQKAETLGSAESLVTRDRIPVEAMRESEKAHAVKPGDDLDYDVGRGQAQPAAARQAVGGERWPLFALGILSLAVVGALLRLRYR